MMKELNIFILCIIAIVFISSCQKDEDVVMQYTLSLQPDASAGKDAVFSKIVPENNYAELEDIHLYAYTQEGVLNVNRVAIDFDFSSLPNGSQIDSACLSLYFNDVSRYGDTHLGATDFVIERIVTPWEETTITWQNQPLSTLDNQVNIEGAVLPNQDFVNMDVTAIIEDYIEDPLNSHGFLLRLKSEIPYKQLLFASSDHPNSNVWPKLDIYYTLIK